MQIQQLVGIAITALMATVYAQQPPTDHVEIIAKTPCLLNYRTWFFSARTGAVFQTPAAFTADQCANAILLHDRIQAEQAAAIPPPPTPYVHPLVRATPCLADYRRWVFGGLPPERFERPDEFSVEQCAKAAEVHERMQAEEVAAPARQAALQRQSDLAAARAASERQAAADALQKQRARLQQAARDTQARKPGVHLGMSSGQVLRETNWGQPESISRRTDAGGTMEFWRYGSNSLIFRDGVLTVINN